MKPASLYRRGAVLLAAAIWPIAGCTQQPTAPPGPPAQTAEVQPAPQAAPGEQPAAVETPAKQNSEPPVATTQPEIATNPEPAPAASTPPPKVAQAAPPAAAAADSPLGEQILSADQAPDDAPLRPIDGLPIYKLSDLKTGNPGPGPGTKLIVHYERLSGDERGTGPALVIRTDDGNETQTIGGFGPFQGKKKSGDYVVDLGFRGPFSRGLPKSLEVYLVHGDRRWEGEDFHPRFKVSNSAVMGEFNRPLQFAREWTPDEEKKINDPPPTAPQVNTNKNMGEDTDFVGFTEGLIPALRYADDEGRPVIGLLYRLGKKAPEEGAEAVTCLIHLTPAYHQRQPRYGQEATFAKAGYALGGLNTKHKGKLVTAVQGVFMRQKPDGTLDTADSYTGKWLGDPEAGDTEHTLTGDGRKLIGMHLKNFGALHAAALVLE